METTTAYENPPAREDLWQKLRKAAKPILLYGMGNGADKILAVFAKYGIKADDVFASDEFVRGQMFHGRRVLKYAEAVEIYGDFIIIVAFGSRRADVLKRIYELASRHELYIPDVPVAGGELFDLEYYYKHKDELERAESLLCDELSRRTLRDIINYRLTGELKYLVGHTVHPDDVYTGILSAAGYEAVADLGAYNGDSLDELARYAARLKYAVALEPDNRTYRKLKRFAESQSYKIDAYNAAAWDHNCELTFTAGANRNSTLITSDALKAGAKSVKVDALALDSLGLSECDYIKYDVEGAEYEALIGSRETIARCRPELLVSLYHRSEDIFKLPLTVWEMGYRRLYIRRYESIPAWELNLLAVK